MVAMFTEQSPVDTVKNALTTKNPAQNAVTTFRTEDFDSQLKAKDVPAWTCKLDVSRPVIGNNGKPATDQAMRAKMFGILHGLDKGTPVVVWGIKNGVRFSRSLIKHMSTPVQNGRAFGEVSFYFRMPDDSIVSAELPMYRIVGIECTVRGKRPEWVKY